VIRDVLYGIYYPPVCVNMIAVIIGDELPDISRCCEFDGNFKAPVTDDVSNDDWRHKT
jgi:hypothetical protein